MADESLDPRYDPMFQRGYAPGGSAPARRVAQDSTEPPVPYIPPLSARPVERAADPLRSPGSVAVAEEAARAELRARAEAAVADAQHVGAPADAEPTARRDVRRNPFLWAVVVIGALLIISGIGLLQDLDRQLTDTGTGTATNYLQLQFEMSASPLALALGIAAILSVVLVHGVEWQRRG